MKSDFEKRAAQEAVDAVERRWRREHEREMRARTRKVTVRVTMTILLLVGLLVGGGMLWTGISGREVASVLSAFDFRLGDGPNALLAPNCQRYGERLRPFLSGEVRLSSEMPVELRIKNAQPDVAYAILTTPNSGWFGLYELARDAKGAIVVNELSPVCGARQVTTGDLRTACGGLPHLVAVRGQVYLFASKDIADAERLRDKVRAVIGK